MFLKHSKVNTQFIAIFSNMSSISWLTLKKKKASSFSCKMSVLGNTRELQFWFISKLQKSIARLENRGDQLAFIEQRRKLGGTASRSSGNGSSMAECSNFSLVGLFLDKEKFFPSSCWSMNGSVWEFLLECFLI